MIEISNLTQAEINQDLIKKIANEILKLEKREKENLSIVLTGPQKIKNLNKIYRRKNKVTTVLSFPLPEVGLGEIFLCPRRIKKEAKREGIEFRNKLIEILIHGILNLTEDSEKERVEKEKKYLKICQKI